MVRAFTSAWHGDRWVPQGGGTGMPDILQLEPDEVSLWERTFAAVASCTNSTKGASLSYADYAVLRRRARMAKLKGRQDRGGGRL